MIVTSYTSLVIESHKSDCAGFLDGIARRLPRRNAPRPAAQAYREMDFPLMPLAASVLVPVEMAEIVPISSGEIRGAA
jgi:hypothetical protein